MNGSAWRGLTLAPIWAVLNQLQRHASVALFPDQTTRLSKVRIRSGAAVIFYAHLVPKSAEFPVLPVL